MAQGSTSDKAKEALKALIAEKKVTMQPIWLEEELDAAGLVFASGERSAAAVERRCAVSSTHTELPASISQKPGMK